MNAATHGPLLVEDLLLLLFDPRSGTIAGEGTLFYARGGAVLADLALQGLVEVDDRPSLLGPRMRALHRDIPWSDDVHTRGKELERGDWGAAAVGQAVTRTAVAVAASSIAVAIAINPGR